METLMSDEVLTQTEDHDDDRGYIAYLFTNDAQRAGVLHQLLEMFHRGVLENTIGIMEAKNKESGAIERLIVGVEHNGADTFTYPLARLLNPDEAQKYAGPDGKGGYLDEDGSGTVN
jgi:hypothetical protein